MNDEGSAPTRAGRTRIGRRGLLLGGLAAPALLRPALAQGFPTRSIRLVVPFTPGGAADITARLVGERMSAILGQSVVVENRGGAGGNIAAEVVARSAPDGYTLFLGGATIFCANKDLYGGRIPFDPMKDFTHLSRVSIGTTLLAVNASSPWRNFAEFISAAKEKPGGLTMASSGQGTISHLSLAKLMQSAGVQITHVPYRGLAPALNDLLAGSADMIFDGIPAIIPHVREGRLRALAVGSAKRVDYVPGLEAVPGMAELLPGSGMDMEFWYSIDGPAGLAPDVAARLHGATVQAAKQPDYRERLQPLGFMPVTDASPAAFTRYIEEQTPTWQELVRVSGARLE
ncbi:Bug family tripartite tricarboxylate transporter substrate binding protein [Pararoseomonas indoligenes]|uniref:Tripartite tricarboxylate transporter substrate binding protein n=1 Tax=Roseomonas indoligenes TaxID=2820811 RepID=A0A940N3T6_9PROT|nr:tripartite tricarboxylate transporter substrate binding protein [Pararoseomonas indoligenes]MBP0496187.1 tripartite tricarboxylate transporter substrate binding protein [Pararoseomonas indoligenes]